MNTSVYKYIRPIFVLCAILGSFCATKIFTDNTYELKFEHMTFPMAIFVFQRSFVMFINFIAIKTYTRSNIAALGIIHIANSVIQTLLMMSHLIGSKQIIRVIQSIDILRNNIIQNPYRPKKSRTNPIVFTSFVLFLLIAVHLAPLTMVFHFPWKTYWIVFGLFSFGFCFPFRQCALYSCVYYSCALAVFDTVQIWRHQSKLRSLQPGFLSSYCSLIYSQASLLKDIDGLLQYHVLRLIFNRVVTILSNSFHFIESDSVVLANVIYLVLWSIFLGLVFLTMNLFSDEYNNLKQEVFLIRKANMFEEESVQVRVLLAQLDNKPGLFTVGGIVDGGPSLLMTFTALGIEYFITLYQNIEVLRHMIGITPEVMNIVHKT